MIHRITTGLTCILLIFVTTMTSAQSLSNTGKVVKVINVKSYIYLQLEDPSIWIATSPQALSEGDVIKFSGGMEMRNFYSKSLSRTFDSIIFVQNVSLTSLGLNSLHSSSMKPEIHGTDKLYIPNAVSVKPPGPGEVAPLTDGNTIADIVNMSSKLNTQTVKLRAKVMKVSKNIKGKNWITLQDGSGIKPNNKLLVTTSEIVAPGSLVIVSGVVKTDIDLGSGYTYKVLLENATFTKEVN